MAEGDSPLMSEVFRPYERLVEITVLGKRFMVPDRNSLLRAFQFISPETIPYGRFCWNQDCQYCRVDCKLTDEDQARAILSCKFIVSEGMDISKLAPELVGCLRTKLDQPQLEQVAGTTDATPQAAAPEQSPTPQTSTPPEVMAEPLDTPTAL